MPTVNTVGVDENAPAKSAFSLAVNVCVTVLPFPEKVTPPMVEFGLMKVIKPISFGLVTRLTPKTKVMGATGVRSKRCDMSDLWSETKDVLTIGAVPKPFFRRVAVPVAHNFVGAAASSRWRIKSAFANCALAQTKTNAMSRETL